ncbi:MAG: ABC transporter ATP-binding protein, partial [Oscillospiraceae bacterium]
MAIISTAFVALQVFLDLRLPDYMKQITMLIQTPGSLISEIWLAGGKMLLCALLSLATSIIVGYLAARIAAGFSKRLRSSVFQKVQSFSLGEINRFSTPSLITRSTNDITQVQMLIAMGLQVMIKAPIMAVWAIAKISGQGWQWTTATAVAVIFLLVVVTTISIFVIPRFKRIQSLTDGLNRLTRENLTGLRVIRAYNAENYQQGKFDDVNTALMDNNLFTSRIMAVMMPCMTIIMNGLTLAVYWIGASLIDAAGLAEKMGLFSSMLVFSSYAMQVVMAFMMLTMIFIMLPRVAVSAHRINEVLGTKVAVRDGHGVSETPNACGEVEFKNVSFKYPHAEDYVIRNVSFKANKGETIAFIGSTGCGKSTIINLIPRFYDATEGEVLVDGVNVREYTQAQLRNKLGYVPQRSVLFTGTVSSNVAFGENGKPEPSLAAIQSAVKIA